MAARFKKRPPGNQNKLLKLDLLTVKDLICTVCQSIYVEPVSLPCDHVFCLSCFNGTIENNALSCPLCRTRIGSWLRSATKQNKLVNIRLWEFIKEKFSDELNTKLSGGDLNLSDVVKERQISAPGEIRSEYEAEMNKIRNERLLIEQKHSRDTELLIRKLQDQEQQETEAIALKLKKDEQLARELSLNVRASTREKPAPPGAQPSKHAPSKKFYQQLVASKAPPSNGHKLNTLDAYLTKNNGSSLNGMLTDESSGGESSTPQAAPSPELISTAGRCGRFLKNFLNTKIWGSSTKAGQTATTKTEPKVWEPQHARSGQELSVHSGGVLHRQALRNSAFAERDLIHDRTAEDDKDFEPDTASEDSLAPELCYFKPLQPAPINRFNGKSTKCLAIRSTKLSTATPINEKVPEISLVVSGLEKLKGCDYWHNVQTSAFVCLLSVPTSYIKVRDAAVKTSQPSGVTSTSKSKTSPSKKRNPTKSSVSQKLNMDAKNKPHYNNNLDEVNSERRNKKLELSNGNSNKANRDRSSNLSIETTPKKSSQTRKKKAQKSSSCIKLGAASHDTISNGVLTRSKRSISFGSDLCSEKNYNWRVTDDGSKSKHKYVNGNQSKMPEANHRVLRRNGQISKSKESVSSPDKKTHTGNRRKSIPESETDGVNKNCTKYSKGGCDCSLCDNNGNENTQNNYNKKTQSNGVRHSVFDMSGDFSVEKIDSSVLKEQKRIEEMIAQEKSDLALAKKLQRQMRGNNLCNISTGYTVRTAAKRQATLTELMPTPKKMKT